ncbi:His-Xaa-Ser system radical SAM maturase HxsB [Novosphingobium fuchskuhlense]|uniref:His-Xaa-Ser system radical SAM maturase HxsB n=1 Tax=Novosphingobium fuchskuhlense TaxID=1117702 RepID=A0A124JU96_9SPHN|nr:His-Xaa-Ser system radical SAM maturase HxsB [Novosphingobium fuchskuhlense]KUR71002.1 His-Xaa-Ser system radical SAM maturase HxsB [Novosphingobium fuchskuhlense]
MTFTPLRLRAIGGESEKALFVNDAGRFFLGSSAFLDRMDLEQLSAGDLAFLRAGGHVVERGDALGAAAHARGVADRIARAGPLDYLILVPTLRCNLSCSYCQVSRVNENQGGHDWSDDTLHAVLALLDRLDAAHVKIEFQGGEPTLRPDLIRAVIDRCGRFERAEFVICTNLQRVDDEILALFDRPDVFVSTSLDGDLSTHTRNRTGTAEATSAFLGNLRMLAERHGPTKVSALPTIDPNNPPDIDALLDAYVDLGIDSVFLRPINYQGFARKRHAASREQGDGWRGYYESFVRRIIERNWADRGRVLEETYLSIALRRIFQPGSERHVDLRNPNPMGIDYVVIDHDGAVYPTDEARMLARSGVVDLSIGNVAEGWGGPTFDLLNANSTNQFDPDCKRCAYQPFCGRDLVDDLARYGRIDIQRRETAFCRRHLHLFDLAFRLVYSDDDAIRYSLARWLRLPGEPAAFGQRLA